SDWPWQLITKSNLYLNGQPAGNLNNLAVIANKLTGAIRPSRSSRLRPKYQEPAEDRYVFLVADPRICICRISHLEGAIFRKGDDVLIPTDKPLSPPIDVDRKPNPSTMIVTTDNVDAGRALQLRTLDDAAIPSSGNPIFFIRSGPWDSTEEIRNIEETIEI